MKTLIVTAPEGRHITGYGSRGPGETFDLPDEMARSILSDQPNAFELVKEEKQTEPKKQISPREKTGEED